MENFTLRKNAQRGYGVYSKKGWKKAEQILCYEGRITPTFLAGVLNSMTLNAHFSFEWRKGSSYGFVNHSCQPNCVMDLTSGVPVLTAARDIAADEEVCYNYNTVEVDLNKDLVSFQCHCGQKECIGCVRGFLYLTPAQETLILNICSPYIKKVQAEYAKNRD
jgi:uncharacterized protein